MNTPRIAPLAQPLPRAVAERLARLLPPGMAAPNLFLTVARNEGPVRADGRLRLARPDAALWEPPLLAVFAMVDALVARRSLDDAGFARVRAHPDEATLLEITQLVGHYTGMAMLVGLIRPGFDRHGPGADPPCRPDGVLRACCPAGRPHRAAFVDPCVKLMHHQF